MDISIQQTKEKVLFGGGGSLAKSANKSKNVFIQMENYTAECLKALTVPVKE